MNEKMVDALNILAEKLGVTAEYLWGVLIRQAQVEVITDLIWYAITAVLIVAALRYLPRWLKALQDADYGDEPRFVVPSAALILATLMFALGTVLGFSDTITKVRNPEYWALKEVMKVL